MWTKTVLSLRPVLHYKVHVRFNLKFEVECQSLSLETKITLIPLRNSQEILSVEQEQRTCGSLPTTALQNQPLKMYKCEIIMALSL